VPLLVTLIVCLYSDIGTHVATALACTLNVGPVQLLERVEISSTKARGANAADNTPDIVCVVFAVSHVDRTHEPVFNEAHAAV